MLSFFTYIRNDSISVRYSQCRPPLSVINISIIKQTIHQLEAFGSQKGFEIYKILQKYNLKEMFVILQSSMQSL